MRVTILVLVLVLSMASSRAADTSGANTILEALARMATSPNTTESSLAIEALRSRGPDGLRILFEKYAAEIENRRVGISSSMEADDWRRIASALDRVSAQRDSYASGLYWYTDLERAKAASAESGKPIISLRLLGRLDEELSCANSRFFRLTLYSNPVVSQFMSENFVLHWESVRPVPKITIDFGDGRKLERTLTGNSIHYILDDGGRPVDAVPGLYGAKSFLSCLQRAHQMAIASGESRTDLEREALLRRYHQARIQDLDAGWKADLAKTRIVSPPLRTIGDQQTDKPPTAIDASKRALTKALVVERPIFRRISMDRRDPLAPAAADAAWAKLGELYAEDVRLDSRSLSLIRQKSWKYGRDQSAAYQREVRNLERAVAEDTARNRYTLETALHQWFIVGTATKNLVTLNERVYSVLFLTPSTDPWLGLFPSDSYTGIENDGVRR